MSDPEKKHADEQLESSEPRANEDQAQQLEDLKHSITVDTLHNDEAVKVLANYHGEATWTPEEEKKLIRKIDRRLLSILICTYGLQYYDKAMLSQAVSDVRKHVANTHTFPGTLWSPY